MDIWISECRKVSKCLHCSQPIVAHTPMVVGRIYKHVGSRTFRTDLRWHPNCWVEQGVAKMDMRPILETRGRKKMELDIEARKKRLRIVMKRATLKQRISKLDPAAPSYFDRVVRLGCMMEECKEEIRPFGGVPKGW